MTKNCKVGRHVWSVESVHVEVTTANKNQSNHWKPLVRRGTEGSSQYWYHHPISTSSPRSCPHHPSQKLATHGSNIYFGTPIILGKNEINFGHLREPIRDDPPCSMVNSPYFPCWKEAWRWSHEKPRVTRWYIDRCTGYFYGIGIQTWWVSFRMDWLFPSPFRMAVQSNFIQRVAYYDSLININPMKLVISCYFISIWIIINP